MKKVFILGSLFFAMSVNADEKSKTVIKIDQKELMLPADEVREPQTILKDEGYEDPLAKERYEKEVAEAKKEKAVKRMDRIK